MTQSSEVTDVAIDESADTEHTDCRESNPENNSLQSVEQPSSRLSLATLSPLVSPTSVPSQAPVLGSFNGSVPFVKGGPPVLVDVDATITDGDSSNFGGGRLSVALADGTRTDRLAIRNEGTGAGQVGVSGSNVTYGGTLVGTISGGTSALVVLFNANASPAAAQAVLRKLTFQSLADNPTTLRTILVRVVDETGLSSKTLSKTITVTSSATTSGPHQAPVIESFDGSVSFVKNGPPVLVDADATITDADSSNFGSGRLSVAISSGTSTDRLAIRNEGTAAGQVGVNGTTVTYGGIAIGTLSGGTSALVVLFNANSTPAAAQAVLRNLTFQSLADNPTTPRTILVRVVDEAGLSSKTLSKTLNVTTDTGTNPVGIPAPFWRKVGTEPTFAPSWYFTQTPVTHEIFYDNTLTAIENGNRLKTLFANLAPGDNILIHAGTYQFATQVAVRGFGTEAAPIRIAAAPGERVVLQQTNLSQNAMDVDQTRYLIMEGLHITGGDKGMRFYLVDHIMFYNNELSYFNGGAITANSQNTSFLYFIDNEIHHTGGNGEGFYLGASDGSKVTHDTYVIGNYIHDLDGPLVSQGDGIEIKDKSYAVTVKYNFITGTNYPGIVAYGTGRGMQDRNVIEENVVMFSNDNAIQVSAEAIVRNNLVITDGTAFLSKTESTNPKYLTVENNTFITSARGVRTFNWNAADATGIVFANNAIYSAIGQYIPNGTGNVVNVGNVLITDLAAAFVDLTLDGTHLDATPTPTSPLIGAANPLYLPALDLNGETRTTAADAGAVDF